MKTKSFLLFIALFLLQGVTDTVIAYSDTTGENYVANVDLSSASVVAYDQENPTLPPEQVKIGVKMNSGSHLPGLVLWEFDVDNDSATGARPALFVPFPTAEGGGLGPFKTCEGFDFSIVMAFREQSDLSQMALCSNCVKPNENCVTRGSSDGCPPGCYQLGEPCDPGEPDCYEIGTSCDGCFELNTPCASMTNAAMGLLPGEWYMFLESGGGALQRGSIYLPSDWNLLNEYELCATLPWASLLQRAQDMGADFDFDYTINNAPSYQVSVWYDTAFVDEDDFMDAGSVFNLSDFLPDVIDTKADGEYNPFDPCQHNSAGGYGDVNIDANDVTDFLNEFGRSWFWRRCPNCKN